MLLETLDLRRNDILIYSQNKFNFNENFKIIFKNEKVKRPNRISYFDVCAFIKDPTPKNLIIYRLLTNVTHLDAYSSKYGYFIKINGKVELIYLDPIFAIKDLRHLRFDLDPERFRFKIQQVGLTSLTRKEEESNFAEVYAFDLKAIEAQNQNDKIFADAIFAFDEYAPEIREDEEEMLDPYEKKRIDVRNEKGEFRPRIEGISEDRDVKNQKLNPVVTPNSDQAQDLREEIVSLLKQALGIDAGEKYVVGSRQFAVGGEREAGIMDTGIEERGIKNRGILDNGIGDRGIGSKGVEVKGIGSKGIGYEADTSTVRQGSLQAGSTGQPEVGKLTPSPSSASSELRLSSGGREQRRESIKDNAIIKNEKDEVRNRQYRVGGMEYGGASKEYGEGSKEDEYDDRHLFDLFKHKDKNSDFSKREKETVVLKFR